VRATPETIRLVGGTLCFDFANTTEWEGPGRPLPGELDVIGDGERLVRWGRRLGLLSRSAKAQASEAELAAAKELRAIVHGIFAAVAGGDAPRPAALERLRAVYAEAVAHARVRPDNHTWPLAWPPQDPRSVRFAVAASTIALLADPASLARVRQCPGRNCGALFLDSSGRRRWCSMEVCGSREKMRRLYRRRRDGAERPTVTDR
jgi:predicted RNA-binding Zn ribbon-like protein